MTSYRRARSLFLLVGLAALSGCGNTDPQMQGTGGTGGGAGGGPGGSGGGGGSAAPGSFLPLAVGNRWTYVVRELNNQGQEVTLMKVQTVMPMEPVGGTGPNKDKMAYRMVTTKADGADETISWQAREGDRIVRYREQSFGGTTNTLELEEHWDPYKLRLDESAAHTMPGVEWLEIDQETKIPVAGAESTAEVREVWKVTADRQAVTVQGKSYEVMILTRTNVSQGSVSAKTYWFARGIGKVKEIRADQFGTEELVSYELQP